MGRQNCHEKEEEEEEEEPNFESSRIRSIGQRVINVQRLFVAKALFEISGYCDACLFEVRRSAFSYEQRNNSTGAINKNKFVTS